MNNTSNSSSNDGYSSNGDSTWTTPDLDPLWALPDLNATLGAAYQPQLDINAMPATANNGSADDTLYPSGSDAALYDPQTLAFLNDPQTLVGMQHTFDSNIPRGINDDGALPPQGTYDAITGAGQQLNRAQPTFGNDNSGGNLPLVNAGVQQASAVPYYNWPPMPLTTEPQDWSALELPAPYDPCTAYPQWGYGAGNAQQLGPGHANMQLPPPPPGPRTYAPPPLAQGPLGWQQHPALFNAGQGYAPTTFAAAVDAMGFDAWAALPPPRSVGVPDRFAVRRRTGQRSRREPGATAQAPAAPPGPSLSGLQAGSARGAPAANTRLPPIDQGGLGFTPHLPSVSQPPRPGTSRAPEHPGYAPPPPRAPSAPRRARRWRTAQPSPAGEGSHPATSQALATRDQATDAGVVHFDAPAPALGEPAATLPAAPDAAAPRGRGRKRARDDGEQVEPAPPRGKKARPAAAAVGQSTTEQDAPAAEGPEDPERFRQFCVRVGTTHGSTPGETPGAGPSNLGRNVQNDNNFIACTGTQEERGGEVKKKIDVWDGPESERPTPVKARRYPLEGPRPKGHDWYCRACLDSGKVRDLYWQTVPKARLHVRREHSEDGEPRHVRERGKGSGTKRKKQPPKDEERREEEEKE